MEDSLLKKMEFEIRIQFFAVLLLLAIQFESGKRERILIFCQNGLAYSKTPKTCEKVMFCTRLIPFNILPQCSSPDMAKLWPAGYMQSFNSFLQPADLLSLAKHFEFDKHQN